MRPRPARISKPGSPEPMSAHKSPWDAITAHADQRAARADRHDVAAAMQARGTWHPDGGPDSATASGHPRPFRLGGRDSQLARAYADRAISMLTGAAAAAGIDLNIEYVPITTAADRHTGDLSQVGGKGLFVREVDHALSAGTIDAAVHAMKDVPGDVPAPPDLTFAAYLPRRDVRDVVVFPVTSPYRRLADLPAGARVGTSAVRRRAQISRAYPGLEVVPYRGNVIPRLNRLDERYGHAEGVDALVLALGGLAQVGAAHRAAQVLEVGEMCPAVGAGVVGLRCRKTARDVVGLLRLVDHDTTRACIDAERAIPVRTWRPLQLPDRRPLPRHRRRQAVPGRDGVRHRRVDDRAGAGVRRAGARP